MKSILQNSLLLLIFDDCCYKSILVIILNLIYCRRKIKHSGGSHVWCLQTDFFYFSFSSFDVCKTQNQIWNSSLTRNSRHNIVRTEYLVSGCRLTYGSEFVSRMGGSAFSSQACLLFNQLLICVSGVRYSTLSTSLF